MKKHFLKFIKVFSNFACSPFILIMNNSELAAKYLHNDFDQSFKNIDMPDLQNDLLHKFDFIEENNFFIAENNEKVDQESVLISEIIIEGWENHPEGRKLELAAYDSMSIKPGSICLLYTSPSPRDV